MLKYPVQLGNVVLIILGVVLIVSAPIIIVRTYQAMKTMKQQDPNAKIHWFSDGLNYIIAILFFLAGIFFVINNLRGNPLA